MTKEEMERGFQEIWKLFAETDRKVEKMWKETAASFKETDKRFKETDQKFKETDRKFQETMDQIRLTDRKYSTLTDKWGQFVEGLVSPAAIRLFRERGIEVRSTHKNVKVTNNGQDVFEVDIMLVNTEYVVLIEVKSTLGVEDVYDHLDRISKFKTHVPEYSDRKVVGAVAGIVIKEDADKHAYRKGLYVIAQSGDSVTILNDLKFKPKIW